jgi:hypothetical protein
LRECLELPHLLLYLRSVFFLERQYPWPPSLKIFLCRLCQLQCISRCHAGKMYARIVHIASAVILSANKNFHGKMAMDIFFQRKKKQNSNRTKVVGVLSVLAKVKNSPCKDRLH